MSRIYLIACAILLAACSPGSDEPLPTLAVLPDIPPTIDRMIKPLNFWEAVTGVLSPSHEQDRWQFPGSRGDNVSLRVIGYNIDVSLTLQTQTGEILAEGSDIQNILPADGQYLVLVTLVQAGDGSYELGLGYTDQVNPAEFTPTPLPEVVGIPTPTPPYSGLGRFISHLESGERIGGILSEDEPEHVYAFEGEAEQVVNIEMARVSGTIDPVLTLYNPEGIPLAMDDNSGGNRAARLSNIRLPEPGLYSIQVTGDGFFGTYSLALSNGNITLTPEGASAPTLTPTPIYMTPTIAPAIIGNRLEDHTPVLGRLNRPTDFAQFSVYAVAGERITIGVSPWGDPGLRSQIEVYGPEGTLVATTNSTDSNDSGNAILPALEIPETGAYIIFVNGEEGNTGGYLISYGSGNSRQNILRGTTTSNTRIEGDIVWRGLRDVWHLDLTAGDVITAAVSPSGPEFDPYLELVTLDGRVVAVDDNSGGERESLINAVEITETGTYQLRIRDATALYTGSYTLVWRYINRAPTPTPIPDFVTLMSVDDFVSEDTYNFYVFQGQAGQRIQIRVIAKAGTNFDPVAVLIAPDGTIIAEGDDSENTLNPKFEAILPVDGSYSVRVNGYLSEGAFDIYTELLLAP